MTAAPAHLDRQPSEAVGHVVASGACVLPAVSPLPHWPALAALLQPGSAMHREERGAPSNPLVDAISDTTAILMASALGFGLVVSGDLRVNEKGAAKLLGCSHEHLKAMRQLGNAPVCYAIGVDGSRLSYRLNDLASWIEAGREDVTRG